MLTTAFEENASKVKNHSIDPTDAAVDVEYEIFSSNKIQQSYKLSFNKKVSSVWLPFLRAPSLTHHPFQLKEIQSLTKQEVLHQSLKAPAFEKRKEEPLKPDLMAGFPPVEGAVEVVAPPKGFVKASRLVAASKKDGEEKEEEEGRVEDETKCVGKLVAAFVPASQILTGQESSANSSSRGAAVGKSLSPVVTSKGSPKPKEKKITDFFRG